MAEEENFHIRNIVDSVKRDTGMDTFCLMYDGAIV